MSWQLCGMTELKCHDSCMVCLNLSVMTAVWYMTELKCHDSSVVWLNLNVVTAVWYDRMTEYYVLNEQLGRQQCCWCWHTWLPGVLVDWLGVSADTEWQPLLYHHVVVTLLTGVWLPGLLVDWLSDWECLQTRVMATSVPPSVCDLVADRCMVTWPSGRQT